MKNDKKLILIVTIASIFSVSLYFGCNLSIKKNEPVKVNLTIPQTAYSIPTIIAIEKGFFKENNLAITVNYVKTGKIAMDDLLGGKADFSNIVETNVAFAGFNNANIKVLCNIEKVYDASIVARKDKGITNEMDLRGKKIGVVLATTSQVYAENFLAKHALSKDSIRMINLLPPAMQSAIIEGSGVDAISLWQPYVYNVQKALGDKAIVFTDKSIFTGYMNLAGNTDFISKNEDAVKGMLKGYIKAEEFLKSNKAESIDIIARVLSLDKTIIESIWDEYEFHISMTKELINATNMEGKWIISTQKDFQNKQLPDYNKYFDGSFLKSVDQNRVNW